MPNSTGNRSGGKTATSRPPKPYASYPLYAHPSGNWAKKVRGRFYYFGKWGRRVDGELVVLPDGGGWKAALELYKAQADDLHAGRTPRTSSDGLTVAELCNRFLTAKLRRVESGELSVRTLAEYRQTCEQLAAAFGSKRLVTDLAADDFERLRADLAKRVGPVRLGNEVGRVKSLFKYATDNALIDQPVRMGSEFRKPGKAVMRRHKEESDKKLFTAEEVRALLEAAEPTMRAAILLGLNAGAGNTDISSLQRKHLDLDVGWLNFARGKTGIRRRVPLWGVTCMALRLALSARPAAKDPADAACVFLTSAGTRMIRVNDRGRTDYIGRDFGQLLRKLRINGRKGLGWYSLRHTFATIALQSGDRDAVRSLMGHAENDVLATYDESGPSDARLIAVAEHVRMWLFGQEGGAK